MITLSINILCDGKACSGEDATMITADDPVEMADMSLETAKALAKNKWTARTGPLGPLHFCPSCAVKERV